MTTTLVAKLPACSLLLLLLVVLSSSLVARSSAAASSLLDAFDDDNDDYVAASFEQKKKSAAPLTSIRPKPRPHTLAEADKIAAEHVLTRAQADALARPAAWFAKKPVWTHVKNAGGKVVGVALAARSRAWPRFTGYEAARFNIHDVLLYTAVVEFNRRLPEMCGYTDDVDAKHKAVPLTHAVAKSWMLQESGGGDSRSSLQFCFDPLQANVPGDWTDAKAELGLVNPGTAAGKSERKAVLDHYSHYRKTECEGAKKDANCYCAAAYAKPETVQRLYTHMLAGLAFGCRKGYSTAGRKWSAHADKEKRPWSGWYQAIARYNGRSKALRRRPSSCARLPGAQTKSGRTMYRWGYATRVLARAHEAMRGPRDSGFWRALWPDLKFSDAQGLQTLPWQDARCTIEPPVKIAMG